MYDNWFGFEIDLGKSIEYMKRRPVFDVNVDG